MSVSDGTANTSKSISIIVSAVNDAPTLDNVDSTVNVLETIASDLAFVIVGSSDVDGDSLTYTLTGNDASIFSVDSSGRISFKNSPNFKNPLDVDSNNKYEITLTVTDPSGSCLLYTSPSPRDPE